MMSEETWGPWVEWDGCDLVPDGVPLPIGTRVQLQYEEYGFDESIVGAEGIDDPNYCASWLRNPPRIVDRIIRYRVRVDREHSGMSVLRSLLNGIPVKETEDA